MKESAVAEEKLGESPAFFVEPRQGNYTVLFIQLYWQFFLG